MKHKICSILVAVTVAFAAFAEPKTIYVDKNVASSGDGTSWATAFKTIQEGVSAASEGDTVLVAPGEYGEDQGELTATIGSQTQKARVWISKAITLKSRDGKETTHIVGRRGDGSGHAVDGKDPVMCVLVLKGTSSTAKNTTVGATVEGFTIRDGETSSDFTAAGPAGVGNPFFSTTSSLDARSNFVYVAYCTISNCCAQRTSAMRLGTAIGTLFADNMVWGSSVAVQAQHLYAYNCIFTRNSGGSAVLNGYTFANCTIANVAGARGACVSTAYNTAQFDNGNPGDNTATAVYSCVYDGDGTSSVNTGGMKSGVSTPDTVFVGSKANGASTPATHARLCMAACAGDFRPVVGGYLYGLDGHYGNIEYTNLDFIPPEYKQRDFYGRKLADDAVIPIGVILPAETPAAKPLRINSTTVSIGGSRVLVAGQYVNSTRAYRQVVIEPVSSDSVLATAAGDDLYPRRDGTYLYTFRASDGDEIDAFTHWTATHVYYVDRSGGSDSNDGLTAGTAFQSIQKAMSSLPTTDGACVRVNVAEGIYDNESGTLASWGGASASGTARIAIDHRIANTSIRVLVRAVGETANTVVEGGTGDSAMRCVLVENNTDCHVGFSGFTFRSGSAASSGIASGNGGAACAYLNGMTCFNDCVFTGNAAANGAAGYNCDFRRCRFGGNASLPGAATGSTRGVVANGTVSSSIFEANADDAELVGPGAGASLYNCTIYVPGVSGGYAYIAESSIYNSIFTTGGIYPASENLGGNIFFGADDANILASSGFVKANPKFAAASSGDYRPNSGSPVWAGGTVASGEMVRYVCGDFYGNPVMFTADGKIVPGAVHAMGEAASKGMAIFFK